MEDDQILVCEECGSQDILTLMWVNPNTNEVSGELSYEIDANNWCKKCCKHVSITSLEEYKLNQIDEYEEEV